MAKQILDPVERRRSLRHIVTISHNKSKVHNTGRKNSAAYCVVASLTTFDPEIDQSVTFISSKVSHIFS